ncbi:MAG TPA: STAS domain-containing protein [Thermomonospora sp.]|nr:STAS domain-containing protein [Thermomonospora sp.]
MLTTSPTPRSSTPQPELPPTSPPADGDRASLTVEHRRHGAYNVLTMSGRLHAATVVAAEAEILSTIVLAGRPLHLVLDLTDVTAIDSRGISLLAKTRFAVRAVRGALHIIAPDDSPAHRVLREGLLSPAVHQAQRVADVIAECDAAAPARE